MTNDEIKEMQEIKSRAESNTHRIDRIEADVDEIKQENKAIYELSASVKLLANNMTNVQTDVSEVKGSISNLNQKLDTEVKEIKEDVAEAKMLPTKAKSDIYDKVVWLIVGGVVTAIVTAVIGLVAN